MNAYTEDLSEKIIEALRRGMGKSEAARTCSVSFSSVKRYAKLAEEGARLPPKRDVARKNDLNISCQRMPLERVMNLGENRIEMRIPRSAWVPRDLRFPHS